MKKIIIALLLLSPFMPAIATNDVSNIENQLSEIQDRLWEFADSQTLEDLLITYSTPVVDELITISQYGIPTIGDYICQLHALLDGTLNSPSYGLIKISDNTESLLDLSQQKLAELQTLVYVGIPTLGDYINQIYNVLDGTLNSPSYGLSKIFENIKSLVDLTQEQINKDESQNKVLKDQLSAIEQAIYQVKGALSWAEGDENDGLAYLLRGIKDDVEKQNPFFEDYQDSQGSTDSFALPEYYTFSVLNDLNKDIKEINLQSSINPEYQCQNLFDMIKQYFKRSIEMQSSDHKGLAVIARAILQTDPKQNEVEQDVKMALADAHSQMHEIQAEYSFKDLEDKIKFDQHEKYFDFDDLLDQFKFSTPNNWFSLGQVSLSDNAQLYLDFDISGLMPYLDFSRRLFTGLYFVCLAGLVWFIWNKILPFLYKFASYIKTLFS